MVWNRGVKTKPGSSNIPLDLLLEFYNKVIKEAVKKLGPSASQKSLDRICHSLGMTTAMMKLFDSTLSVFRRSGKHIQKSTRSDTEKPVHELVKNKAFTPTPGRKYTFYAKMKPSILCGFDLRKMFSWINEHKKHMIHMRVDVRYAAHCFVPGDVSAPPPPPQTRSDVQHVNMLAVWMVNYLTIEICECSLHFNDSFH